MAPNVALRSTVLSEQVRRTLALCQLRPILSNQLRGKPMVVNAYDSDKRKLLSAVCHGAIFLSATVLSVGIPIAILVISDDPVTKGNARESINFHFNVWLYGIIFGLLCWVLIGWPLLGILVIVQFVMPILAIMHCLTEPDEAYRYPFIFRLF